MVSSFLQVHLSRHMDSITDCTFVSAIGDEVWENQENTNASAALQGFTWKSLATADGRLNLNCINSEN